MTLVDDLRALGRGESCDFKLGGDAADEIERLRFLLRDVRDRIDAHDWQAHVTSLLSRIDAELNESTKERGEIVNPHVQDHAPEPQPDFDILPRHE